MRKIFLLLTCCYLASCGQTQTHDQYIKAEKFAHPTVEYRSVPFYSVNDKLDTAVVAKDMKILADGGSGGINFHTRTGLLTDYMGEEFMSAVDVAVREAESNGIKVWFYDEDKWPSGFASGKVPREHPEYVQQSLIRIEKSVAVPQEDILYADDNYNYAVYKSKMGDAWFNGATYVDLLDHDVVRTFIETAYVPYAQRYKNQLGKSARGMFTDEPQISPRAYTTHSGQVSYTPKLFETFEQMHGYDLRTKLPRLFDTKEDYAKVRMDYYRTIGHLFEVNFTKQIGDFCRENNMVFQGHFNGEETIQSTARQSGNHMAMYRHMDMPGMDLLSLSQGDVNTPKSLSSVANQYDIPWRMSESFGIAGHNMNFEDRKWIVDWLTNTGINYNVPHLVLYSMKGERKRDYPPTFMQQPYWRYNKIYEDYAARMFYATSIGRYDAHVALIHPIESAYIEMDPADFQWHSDRNGIYNSMLRQLHDSHRDYDLADEKIMSEVAQVKGGELKIGQMSYKALVLPSMLTIRESTLKLLDEFHKQGGAIFVLKEYPAYVDGVENASLIAALKDKSTLAATPKEIVALLDKSVPPVYTFEGDNSDMVWTSTHKAGNGYVIQLSNNSRKEKVDGVLTFAGEVKNVALWDPTSGKSHALKPNAKGEIYMTFAQAQTWIVSTGDASREADMKSVYEFKAHTDTPVAEIGGQWSGHRVDPNVVTLDFGRFSIDGGKIFMESEPIIALNRRMEELNFKRGELMVEYTIKSNTGPVACSLVMEQPEMYSSIEVNGKPVDPKPIGTFIDQAFKVLDIGKAIVKGENKLRLTLDYVAPISTDFDAYKRYGTEVESIYLIGDFAVEATESKNQLRTTDRNSVGFLIERPIHTFTSFALGAERDRFEGELALQGYPFYAGEFILDNTVNVPAIDKSKRYFIRFPDFEAIIVKVKVNGVETSEPLAYHPYEVDVTELLQQGDNTVSLSLTNSLRNMLGPHHHVGGELISVGPQTFTGESTWTSSREGDNDWYNKRKNGTAKIWRDDYYMIPFGLLKNPVLVARSNN